MVDTSSFEHIDSFPYRHRVRHVMSSPVVTIVADAAIADASRHMVEAGISSLVVVDEQGRSLGIITERDVLRTVAGDRERAIGRSVGSVMSSPVVTVRDDALVYVAMGRMDRLKLRHLVATDRAGRATGMVTLRGLLRLRTSTALALGDEVMTASDAAQMAVAKAKLPALARALIAEGLDGRGIAAVSTSVLADMTARAAELAHEAMRRDAWGEAPVPWCLLLLGSGGRRESLFGPDQDNAIVHAGPDIHDPWFAELGRRLNEILDAAGIPLCRGGVMARNERWRHSLTEWLTVIDSWMGHADGDELLNIAIFCDFRGVYGDPALAEDLRRHLTAAAQRSPGFLHALAASASNMGTALGVLGQFKTREGRIDIKLTGLLPLVSTVRLLALKHGIAATGTGERLMALADAGHMPPHEAQTFADGHELMMRLLFRQQIADIEAGIPTSNRIDPQRLRKDERDRLKQVLRSLSSLHWLMSNALSTV